MASDVPYLSLDSYFTPQAKATNWPAIQTQECQINHSITKCIPASLQHTTPYHHSSPAGSPCLKLKRCGRKCSPAKPSLPAPDKNIKIKTKIQTQVKHVSE